MRLALFVKSLCWGCQEWERVLEERGLSVKIYDIDENFVAREYIQKMHCGQVPVLRDEDSRIEFEGFQEDAAQEFLLSLAEGE